MQYRFFFKQMPSSDALKQIAEEKLSDSIMKFVTKPIEALVSFSVSGASQTVHCSLSGGDGFDVEVEASSEDMYHSIDLAANKLNTQLRKRKEKLKEHKGNADVRHISEAPRGRPSSPDYVDAEDILKYEAAMRRRAR